MDARNIVGRGWILAAAAAAIVGTPADGSAQLRVVPQVGLYVPLSDLPDPGTAVDIGERESSLAYGLGVEIGGTGTFGLRATVLHATDSEIPVGEVGCEGGGCARSTVTAATAALTVSPFPDLPLLRPYLLAGGGVKRYDFDREDLSDEGVEAVLSDENVFTAHLGLGLEVNLGVVRLAAELSDLVGKLEPDEPGIDGETQHDMFLTIGLVLGGG